MGKRHSMKQARKVQKAFAAKYAETKGVLAIGIGLNAAHDDLALNVAVTEPAEAADMPRDFQGLDVVVDVVGAFRTH
jgi:hypothetical protein